TVTLADGEGGGTRLSYTAAASIGGKLGQIGGRMIDASAKQTADQFFAAFAAQLGGAAPPTAPPAAASAASAPAAAADASPAEPSAAFAPRLAVAGGNASAGGPSEGVRVLWFLLGAGATTLGFWLAKALGH
ncbi:MAG: SRPBCC domain-containing protein, partial [Burkholderiaceae bacterium]